MNELINEQQNMMDLSGIIDINTELKYDFDEIDSDKINKNKDEIQKEENFKDNNSSDIIDEQIPNSINQNKINEDKNRESYISLFKLGEYLYYYRCKTEEDLINIKANQVDENSNLNNSPRNIKKKVSKIKSLEEEENSKINVFKDKDITYMWYMEAKKKKNKSFNYQLSDNYEELFMDLDMQ